MSNQAPDAQPEDAELDSEQDAKPVPADGERVKPEYFGGKAPGGMIPSE